MQMDSAAIQKIMALNGAFMWMDSAAVWKLRILYRSVHMNSLSLHKH